MPVFVAPLAGLLSSRTGTRPLLVVGMALQAIALGWLSIVLTPTVDYLTVVPAFILAGGGMGLFFAPTANVVPSAGRAEAEGKEAWVGKGWGAIWRHRETYRDSANLN